MRLPLFNTDAHYIPPYNIQIIITHRYNVRVRVYNVTMYMGIPRVIIDRSPSNSKRLAPAGRRLTASRLKNNSNTHLGNIRPASLRHFNDFIIIFYTLRAWGFNICDEYYTRRLDIFTIII